MRAGKLRHLIDIEELVEGTDEMGQPISEWQSLVTAWAAIEPLKGDTYWAIAQAQSDTTHQ